MRKVSIVLSVFLCSTLLVSPAPAEAQNIFKNLQKELKKVTKPNKKNSSKNNNLAGAAIGGVVGGVVGSKIGSKKAVGTLLGVAVGAYVGSEISKSISKNQQDKVAGATVDAFVSGEDQEWTDPETKSKNTVRIIESNQKNEPVTILVDRNSISTIADIDLIGETFLVQKSSNVRGGPGTEYDKVAGLVAGETTNVVGKVKEQPWYMVSRKGVAYGYVFEPLLKRQSASIVAEPVEQSPETLESVETIVVAASQECRTVEQSVTSDNGDTLSETMTACKGGNGWEVKVASADPDLFAEPLPGNSSAVISDANPLPILPVLPVVEPENDSLNEQLIPSSAGVAENQDGYLVGNLGAFEISSMIGGSNWCGPHVAARIDYPEGAFELFNARSAPSEAADYALVAKGLCADMRSIQFSHNPDREAGDALFTYGDIQWLSADDNFQNLTQYKFLEQSVSAENAHRCDELASIPNDPRKPLGITPIADANFTASEEAKSACLQAVLLEPEQSRHYTHLGRILAFQGDFDGAFAAFKKAKEMGNGSAMQYLGTLMVEGWGTEPDMRSGNAEWEQAKLYGAGRPSNPDAIAKAAGVERRN